MHCGLGIPQFILFSIGHRVTGILLHSPNSRWIAYRWGCTRRLWNSPRNILIPTHVTTSINVAVIHIYNYQKWSWLQAHSLLMICWRMELCHVTNLPYFRFTELSLAPPGPTRIHNLNHLSPWVLWGDTKNWKFILIFCNLMIFQYCDCKNTWKLSMTNWWILVYKLYTRQLTSVNPPLAKQAVFRESWGPQNLTDDMYLSHAVKNTKN